MKILESASDVTPAILKSAEECWDGWFAESERIDWNEFIDRLCDTFGNYSTPPWDIEEYDNPAVRQIRKHVNGVRRES